ncbi:hypothetical protein E4T47_07637 [Aureobasidium subglaciale]|nr:hypothetical protein E4T47_07637 [Aureobasidium subglaciale]
MSHLVRDVHPRNVLSSPTSLLYSVHFAALATFSGVSTLLSAPLLLSPPVTGSLQIIGNTLMSLSVSLFTWTAYTTQRGRLPAIFGGKTPDFVIDFGPFAHVRHPTYTAYLLGWTGALVALADRHDAGWRVPALSFCILGLAGVYRSGVQMEEDQMLSGEENDGKVDLSKKYREYMAKVKSRWLPGLV